MNSVSIEITPTLLPVVGLALTRLGYLFPEVEWSFDADKGCVEAKFSSATRDIIELRKELYFQLYRENIFRETTAIRNQLFEAI